MESILIEQLETQVQELELQLSMVSNSEDRKLIQQKLQSLNYRLTQLYGEG